MKTSYILMLITILSKVFGLLREQALAYFFGTSLVADVFLVAFQLPMTFTNIITGAVANGYIPVYDKAREKGSKEYADKFTANLSNIILVFSIIITILALIFARPLVKLMAEGFSGEKLDFAVFVSRAAFLSIFVTCLASIFKAYLQIYNKFILSISHAILMNIIIIFFMYFAYKNGVNFIALGLMLGFILQYIIFIFPIKKLGYRHKLILNFKDENIKSLFRIILPILISTSAIEINFMISRSLASGLFVGAISTLNYAYKLQSFVTGIVVSSIITVTYPKMAAFGAENNLLKVKDEAKDAISAMCLLVIPGAFGLFSFSFEIVKLLFVRGEFTINDGKITAVILSFYAFGIIAIAVREIISRIFYSLGNTLNPVKNSILIVIVNIILSFVLSNVMEVRGLALATTISFFLGALSLYKSSIKLVGNIFDKKLLINIGKILSASILMAILSRLCFGFLSDKMSSNLSLVISIFLALIIYGLGLIILRVDEFQNFKNLLKKFKN